MSEEDIVENKEITYYVFVKNNRRHYNPQILSAGETTVKWIFPVPEPHTVGTVDRRSKGIVFVKFNDYGKDPETRIIAQKFGTLVYGYYHYRFNPYFTDEIIAYSITREVAIVNVKTGKAFFVGINPMGEDFIMLGVGLLDPQKKLFALAKSVDMGKAWEDYFYVATLEGRQFVNTGWDMRIGRTDRIERDFPLYNTWFVHDRKLFVYDKEWHKIVCTDGKTSVVHPFSEVFNGNANRIGIVKDFAIHPSLPIGIIIAEYAPQTHRLMVLRWDITNHKKRNRQIIVFDQDLEELKMLFGLDRVTLAYQSLSPDGNWYVVAFIGEVGIGRPSPYFVAIPIVPFSKKHWNFLDMPNLVVLGQVVHISSMAWTSGPTSFVVSDGKLLCKWDLDELPNASVFKISGDAAPVSKPSIFRKIARFFGIGR